MAPASLKKCDAVPAPSGLIGKPLPPMEMMIKRAILGLRSKKGSTTKEIVEYITSTFDISTERCARGLQGALKRMLTAGLIYKQKRGHYKMTGKGRLFKMKKKKKKNKKRKRRRRTRRRKRKSKKRRRKNKKRRKKRKKRRRRKGKKPALRKCGHFILG